MGGFSTNVFESAWNLEMNNLLKNNDMIDLIVLNCKTISSHDIFADQVEATRITGIIVVELLLCCRHCNPSVRIFVTYSGDSFVPSFTSLVDVVETQFNRIHNRADIYIHIPRSPYTPGFPKIRAVLNHERLSAISSIDYIVQLCKATVSDFILSILLKEVNASVKYISSANLPDSIFANLRASVDTECTEDYRIAKRIDKYSFISCGRNYNIKISLLKFFLAFDVTTWTAILIGNTLVGVFLFLCAEKVSYFEVFFVFQLQIKQGCNILSRLSLKLKIATAGIVLGSMVLANAFKGDNVKNIVATASSKSYLYFDQILDDKTNRKIYTQLIKVRVPTPAWVLEFNSLLFGQGIPIWLLMGFNGL